MCWYNNTKTFIMKSIFFMLITAVFILSCKKNNINKPSEIKKTPLVLNVYDYNNDLVAHYEYDENDRLLKREFTDPVNNVSSDLIFHYENG